MNEDDSDVEEDIEEELDTLKDTRNIDPSDLPQLGQTLPAAKCRESISVAPPQTEKNLELQESKLVFSNGPYLLR